ncbi:hypothetical protein GBA52_028976 [Prunus armeniaca]|nr:hypothetical protein GBA52_028976 [Prunus armeniaca]
MAEPVVDAQYLKEVEKARRDLRALISVRNCAPIMFLLIRSYIQSIEAGGMMLGHTMLKRKPVALLAPSGMSMS